ncbi:MAG TPA: MG2 domain-containing protein, partial [Gemmataceae bacterium]|nr:MG2 domain-containing protein [Gemmataceae bacterium]
MPGNRRSRWWAVGSGGLVLAAVLTALGLALLGPRPQQAEAAVLSKTQAGVFKTKDKLLITVGLSNPEEKKVQGTLRVELVGADGKLLGKAEQQVAQTDAAASYRFELPLTGKPADQVKLRCSFDGKQQFEARVSDLFLAKAHETAVTSGQEFNAGSTAALRCTVRGIKSLTESVPLAGAEVEIKLRAGDKTYTLYRGKAGLDGVANASFKVPALPTGSYKIEVATRSALGEEKLERDVRVKSEAKVLLVTDKPLYQPGQVIHIRALALRPFDLRPVANAALTFEVEDGKGNKVFKREHKTSDFGVASVDFQLADEVNMGDYQVRAFLKDQPPAHKTVAVKRYVLPKFKSELTADKKFYLPKETIDAKLQVDYFFGKPVAGGKVKVTASTFDVQFKEFATWEGKTDANGAVKFEIKLPNYFVGQPLQKGDALVKLDVKVTDTADHSETITKTYPVSDQPIRVSVIPEGGRLVPDMENRVFVAAIYPDGSPAKCDVKLWAGKEAKGKPLAEVTTNDAGLAEFAVTPKPEQFRQGNWGQRNVEMLGGQVQQAWGPQMLFDLAAEAKDAKGAKATAKAEVHSEPLGENVILRLDKAICKGGDSLKVDVRTSAGLPTAYLDVVKSGQTLLTRWLDVKDGKAEHRLDLPPAVFGTLEVHAYQMLASGEIIRDTRVIYVQPADGLKVNVKPD